MSNYALEVPVRRLDWLSFAVVRSVFVASGNNSVVECDLAKVEVAGSNPVSRSIPPSHYNPLIGAVAKW